jgi:hypothetical protein
MSKKKEELYGFDEFWSVYPRRVAKLAAQKAYAKALKIASPDKLIEGAKRYAAEKVGDAYIKHPSTWLNGGCWDDEPLLVYRNGHNGNANGHQRRLDQWDAAFTKLSAAADLFSPSEEAPGPVSAGGRRES